LAYNSTIKAQFNVILEAAQAEARRILSQIEEELSKNADAYPVLKGQFAGLRKYRVGVTG